MQTPRPSEASSLTVCVALVAVTITVFLSGYGALCAADAEVDGKYLICHEEGYVNSSFRALLLAVPLAYIGRFLFCAARHACGGTPGKHVCEAGSPADVLIPTTFSATAVFFTISAYYLLWMCDAASYPSSHFLAGARGVVWNAALSAALLASAHLSLNWHSAWYCTVPFVVQLVLLVFADPQRIPVVNLGCPNWAHHCTAAYALGVALLVLHGRDCHVQLVLERERGWRPQDHTAQGKDEEGGTGAGAGAGATAPRAAFVAYFEIIPLLCAILALIYLRAIHFCRHVGRRPGIRTHRLGADPPIVRAALRPVLAQAISRGAATPGNRLWLRLCLLRAAQPSDA